MKTIYFENLLGKADRYLCNIGPRCGRPCSRHRIIASLPLEDCLDLRRCSQKGNCQWRNDFGVGRGCGPEVVELRVAAASSPCSLSIWPAAVVTAAGLVGMRSQTCLHLQICCH